MYHGTYYTALSISGLLRLILAVLAAGYASAVRAMRCADLVLPLQTKDDPTDKFDDAVELVRQFVTFLEVASLRAAPWAQGGSSRSLLRLFAAQREPAKQRASPAQNLNENRLQRQQNREILCKRSTRDDTSMISCPPPDPPVD